jgi:hypothetical protein
MFTSLTCFVNLFNWFLALQVEQNALAEATAMAKMKDDHFELVVNIQRFTPEEVRVYLDGQAVIVAAKHETSDGFVTGNKTNEFIR